MEITNVPDPANKNDFSVKKFIQDKEKYYAVIQPHKTAIKIRISHSDYIKALKAYYFSKSINCYPIDGVLKDDTFEEPVYEMEIK